MSLYTPKTVGERLDRAIRVYRRHFVRLAGIAALGTVPLVLLVALLLLADTLTGRLLGQFEQAIDLITGLVITPALIASVLALMQDRPLTMGGAYRLALGAVLRMLVFTIILGVALLGITLPISLLAVSMAFGAGVSWVAVAALLVAVPLVLLLHVRWFVAPVLILEENAGPIEAMQQSWQLTRGHFWSVAGFVIASGLLIALVTVVPALALQLLLGDLNLSERGMIGLLPLLAKMLILPLTAAVQVVQYGDLRAREDMARVTGPALA